MTRAATPDDVSRYQTVYAAYDGSVAAPTAGLHFTNTVFESLAEKDIRTAAVTLHVGAGTFKPVSSDMVSGHSMHNEQIIIRRELLNAIATKGTRKIIAVGTTTLRSLETIYHLGCGCIMNGKPAHHLEQWDAYKSDDSGIIEMAQAAAALLQYMETSGIDVFHVSTQLMIIPGYRIRSADVLITNFHQPKSTLLLLIAAFVGESWRDAYAYALSHDFRFLSYGDSCLFFRKA
jgi:S-adenosylmethionine:tRNA ribosyltransferase-isomerase